MNPRIATLSQALKVMTGLFLICIPLTVVYTWLFASEATLLSKLPQYWFIPTGIFFESGALTDTIRVYSAAISLLANLPLLLALLHLRQLLSLYQQLDLFQSEAAARMKKFALWIVAYAGLQPIAGAGLSFVTSMNNSLNPQVVSISIADTDLATIFVGVSMLVIAYVLEEAHRISEDNKSFV